MNVSSPQIINRHNQAVLQVNPIRAGLARSETFILLVILAHVGLAFVLRSSSMASTLYAYGVLLAGMFVVMTHKTMERLAFVVAYIAGVEVLWRMTSAQIFWEAGKYFMIFLLLLGMARIKKWKNLSLPILYFGFLAVSSSLTFTTLGDNAVSRDFISFNLSGPLALAVCALFFLQIRFTPDDINQLSWWLLFPIITMVTNIGVGILLAENLSFNTESNFITSGGFGPNQVSAILGMGASFAFLLFLTEKRFLLRWVALLLSLGFLGFSALTFSRGGLYNTIIVIAIALWHFFRQGKTDKFFILVILSLVVFLGGYFIYPYMDSFTGGNLSIRFSDMDTTNRVKLAMADVNLWLENPIFGVGPGMAKYLRPGFFGVAAHTEYSRILSEHGITGLVSVFLLIWMIVRAYRKAPNVRAKMWAASFAVWSLAEMSHAAMRVVAISFLLGLALVQWDEDSVTEPSN